MRINSVGKFLIAGVLSLATPACKGGLKTDAEVGVDSARVVTRVLLSECSNQFHINGQSIGSCVSHMAEPACNYQLKSAKNSSLIAKASCIDEFNRIMSEHSGLD